MPMTDEDFLAMLQIMCMSIEDPSQIELLEVEGPGFLEMLGAFEMLISFLQIMQLGYANRAKILQDTGADDARIQRAKDAPTGLPTEPWELHQWHLVKQRIFPSLVIEFEKLSHVAKFLCLKRFAAMAKFEFRSVFLGDLETSILAHLFYKLTLIMLKDAMGDDVNFNNHLIGRLLAGQIQETDRGGDNSIPVSSFPEACFKFWCSLPANLDHPEEEIGEQ
ncbi:uncharacterized protein N7496_007823 [Penicillium cataractarum]|uniref:Uncharacterized protein n=1 Tax=Penicillium cataractarum TaxID=2100454 RepID=A0A9W9V3Z7_9EURO|nr:uncharacterized protein N7496_007823 [Penicillium cataractarum]KAJ5368063.1 hypothetical protein N7496_007823 [Penicillium cataractarum]